MCEKRGNPSTFTIGYTDERDKCLIKKLNHRSFVGWKSATNSERINPRSDWAVTAETSRLLEVLMSFWNTVLALMVLSWKVELDCWVNGGFWSTRVHSTCGARISLETLALACAFSKINTYLFLHTKRIFLLKVERMKHHCYCENVTLQGTSASLQD